MQLKKEGFVVGIAYLETPSHIIPTQTNICVLFWRFFLGLPSFVLFLAFAFIFMLPAIAVLGFLVARRPNFRRGDESLFCPYAHWPVIRGRRIYPIAIILALAAGYGLWQGVFAYGDRIWRALSGNIALTAMGGTAMMLLFIYGAVRFSKTETAAFLLKWAAAKKARVCPIVHIVSEVRQ